MLKIETDWKPKLTTLKRDIRKADSFESARILCMDMHSMVHFGEMANYPQKTFYDEVFDDLSDEAFIRQLKKKNSTIAWCIWHITRIEDIVANLLIADRSTTIFNNEWKQKMRISITDTGNAMTRDEIADFSKTTNKAELINYRNIVGRQTQSILKELTFNDIKRKPSKESVERIVTLGGLTEQSNSFWLQGFWARHTVAGLLGLPITDHQLMHYNDCVELKNII